MKYPNRIRELRLAAGLTLDQLAALANTSNQQISRLERGERKLSLEWMDRIAQALGREVHDMLPKAPELAEVSDEERRILELIRHMPQADREWVLQLVEREAKRSTGNARQDTADMQQ